MDCIGYVGSMMCHAHDFAPHIKPIPAVYLCRVGMKIWSMPANSRCAYTGAKTETRTELAEEGYRSNLCMAMNRRPH